MEFDQNAQLDTSQISDQRGGGGGGGGGGLGGMLGGSGGKIAAGGGGLGIIGLVLALLFGGGNIFGGAAGGTPTNNAVFPTNTAPASAGVGTGNDGALAATCKTGADAAKSDDCLIVGVVNSVQNYWAREFARSNLKYTLSPTVYFSGATSTGCGDASTDVGPFYCPADKKVYIDLTFYAELTTKFGAQGGTFAKAYVIGHEYGHHVQDLLGTSAQVDKSGSRQGATSGSVRTELQADCYAGVWAQNAVSTGYLEQLSRADIADGLDAASAVGDDRIQERATGRVSPESWTHGSSAQRQKWFTTGYESGDPGSCDTSRGSI